MRAQWTKEHGHEHAQKSMLLIKGLDELIAVAALTSEDELRRATSSGPKRLRTQRALILLGLRGQSYSLLNLSSRGLIGTTRVVNMTPQILGSYADID